MSEPVEEAARAALAGELIVIPTDTVYGIGTRPDDPGATARLFEAKGRPRELELPVLVPGVAAAREIAAFDERAEALALRYWAGPLTIVLQRAERSRGWDLGGDRETVGIRMPHHPLALAVLARTGPLAVTSANRSGGPTPDTCDEVRKVFGGSVAIYLCDDAQTGARTVRRPSTVVDLARGRMRVLRAGAVGDRELREALVGSGLDEPRV